MTTNPFRPAEQVAPKVKALVYGPPGVGKTYLALTAPGKVAVIDTEGGTAFYANRVGPKGLSPFDVLPTKTFAQVEQAVSFLRANPGEYETLVIDPVTVLYETLQDAAQNRRAGIRNDSLADLEMLDWQHIKRAYKRLMTDLVNLPINVVVTAREAELTEQRGRERVHKGWKADAEKSTPYYFDTVLRLVPADRGREAIIEKDRTGTHKLNARVSDPTYAKLFDKLADGEGVERSMQSDEEAARIDAALTMGAEAIADRDEILTPLGSIERTGKIAKGDGLRSDLMARQQPDGYVLGFRLDVGDGKAIPQVVATGQLGAAIVEAVAGDTPFLAGVVAKVTGELLEVQPPGRKRYHRLMLTSISTPDWTLPEPDGAPTGDSGPASSVAGASADTKASDLPASPSTEGASGDPASPDDTALGADVTTEAGDSNPAPSPALCGSPSPYGDDLTCALAPDHKGPHKQFEGFGTSWTD